jgi:PTH1 family peptidyl-tRNA hydrolase
VVKLIVGLGNPGAKYEKNRHNAGFLFLDRLADSYGGSWSRQGRFSGDYCECVTRLGRVRLLKPQTFMNRSGVSVASVLKYYKDSVEDVLVIHDELDFAPGVVKLKKGGGHAGHNGLRDIIAHLGSADFYRLRVGIGRPVDSRPVADYVLSDFAIAERTLLDGVYSRFEEVLPDMLRGDMAQAMKALNGK